MRTEIQNGPLSTAVHADNDCWRFYESGILSSANNCVEDVNWDTYALDHGVVIVGLEESGDKPYWII